jgi:hypothetical protein
LSRFVFLSLLLVDAPISVINHPNAPSYISNSNQVPHRFP